MTSGTKITCKMIIFMHYGIGRRANSKAVSLQILGIAEVHPIFNVVKDTKKTLPPQRTSAFLCWGKGGLVDESAVEANCASDYWMYFNRIVSH